MKLPLPATPDRAVKIAVEEFFNRKLLLDWNAFAPAFYHNDGWWVRCCAQVYNEVSVFFYAHIINGEVEQIFPSDQRL